MAPPKARSPLSPRRFRSGTRSGIPEPDSRKPRWRDRGFLKVLLRLGKPRTHDQRAREDSNLRPSAPQADVLSPELRAQMWGASKDAAEVYRTSGHAAGPARRTA